MMRRIIVFVLCERVDVNQTDADQDQVDTDQNCLV